MQVRRLIQGSTPLLISIPHTGSFLPPDIKRRMTKEGLALVDTDFHVDRLYQFALDMGASFLTATHSRYVVDLNRSQEDETLYKGQIKTGLCPLETFKGEAIYQEDEEPDNIEKMNRISAYWMPYHEALENELERLKEEFGYAILYDAHSIKSEVPRLFEGQLRDLNLGNVNGESCAREMAETAMQVIEGSDYSSVLNGRFIGGFITRHYGDPENNIHALQMELSERNYMNENAPFYYDEEKAQKLQAVLKPTLQSLLDWGKQTYAR